jgi:UDP-GlcNAc:undecaprenyl-phosphate GlcNAc-1-phosphate transferase
MWLWAGLIAFGSSFASLYSGPWMWGTLAAGLVVTLALTFLLPKLRQVDTRPEPA